MGDGIRRLQPHAPLQQPLERPFVSPRQAPRNERLRHVQHLIEERPLPFPVPFPLEQGEQQRMGHWPSCRQLLRAVPGSGRVWRLRVARGDPAFLLRRVPRHAWHHRRQQFPRHVRDLRVGISRRPLQLLPRLPSQFRQRRPSPCRRVCTTRPQIPHRRGDFCRPVLATHASQEREPTQNGNRTAHHVQNSRVRLSDRPSVPHCRWSDTGCKRTAPLAHRAVSFSCFGRRREEGGRGRGTPFVGISIVAPSGRARRRRPELESGQDETALPRAGVSSRHPRTGNDCRLEAGPSEGRRCGRSSCSRRRRSAEPDRRRGEPSHRTSPPGEEPGAAPADRSAGTWRAANGERTDRRGGWSCGAATRQSCSGPTPRGFCAEAATAEWLRNQLLLELLDANRVVRIATAEQNRETRPLGDDVVSHDNAEQPGSTTSKRARDRTCDAGRRSPSPSAHRRQQPLGSPRVPGSLDDRPKPFVVLDHEDRLPVPGLELGGRPGCFRRIGFRLAIAKPRKRMRKALPLPISLSTSRKPPWFATMAWVVESPSPVPSPDTLVVKNGSKIRARSFPGIPRARVADLAAHELAAAHDSIRAHGLAIARGGNARIDSVPPEGIASRALMQRFIMACSSCPASARAGSGSLQTPRQPRCWRQGLRPPNFVKARVKAHTSTSVRFVSPATGRRPATAGPVLPQTWPPA